MREAAPTATADEASGETSARLRDEAHRALATLAELVGPESLLSSRAARAIRDRSAELERTLDRPEVTVAIVGERRNGALLDAWIGRPLFGDADLSGPGPLLSLRRGERIECRAIDRDGLTEIERDEEDDKDDDEDEDVTSVRADIAVTPAVPAPPQPSPTPVVRPWFAARLLDRVVRFLARLFGRGRPTAAPAVASPPPPLPRPAPPRPAPPKKPRKADLPARVRALLARSDLVELSIAFPAAGPTPALLDLRGAMLRSPADAWKILRDRIDAVLLVAGDPSVPATRALAGDLCAIMTHLFVPTREPPAAVATALGIDAGRIRCIPPPPSLDRTELDGRALDHRALSVGIQLIAMLRLGQREIEQSIAEHEARDRERLERLASYRLPDPSRRREDTRRRVTGATAGQTIRIVQGVLAMLDASLAALRDERTRAVAAAGSREAIRSEVAAAGDALATVRDSISPCAADLVHHALSKLAPPLLADLEARVDTTLGAMTAPAGARPAWPGLPTTAVVHGDLVATRALGRGDAFRAEIGWADSLLRSLEKVKKRCAEQLSHDLEAFAQEARTEVLDFEPRLARWLHDTLEAWVDEAGQAYAVWHEAMLVAEGAHRDAAREAVAAGMAPTLDALREHSERLDGLTRALASR